MTGIIAKYNRKTVTVITADGQRWNVAPVFLAKVITAEVADKPHPQPKVIQLPAKR